MLVKHYLSLLLSFLPFVMAAQSDSTVVDISSVWYTLEKPQYNIDYPEGWVLDSSGLMGTTLKPTRKPAKKY